MEIKNICVFTSSSNYLDDSYYSVAKELGKLIGQNGYNIVYGGSTLGMMWQCASQVKQYGGKVIGIMPQKLIDMGCRTDNCDEFYPAIGMRERKQMLDDMSQATIALPGGFGTLEELSEIIVQKQLGYNNKPIVIVNTNGIYDKLLEFFEDIINNNFANAQNRVIYKVVTTPQEAINYIKNYKPLVTSGTKWDK